MQTDIQMSCLNIFQVLGITIISLLRNLGKLTKFITQVFLKLFTKGIYFKLTLKQTVEIGFYSLPVVGLTAIFTGAVLALQTYTGFSRMHAESAIASVVVISITRELGPVLAGLMLAGRVGAAIAAEIGTMRVTEQVDALYTLNTDPFKYLIIPRVIAAVIALPLLVAIADLIGVFGGYLIAVHKLGFEKYYFLKSAIKFLEYKDVLSGLIKAGFFGFIVSIVGCFYGYHSDKGAQGVGRSTTITVVTASILILLANYIITWLMFEK